LIGQTLSHFKITAKLGEGGMGEVYLAEDNKLKRKVALKVLPPEMAGDPDRLSRFQREAETIASLSHPNIVTIFSVEEAEGIHFLTMELVEGMSIDELLPEGGLDLDRFLALAIPLADAVACAHEQGIIHRDLKPANVMVTKAGERVKVLDFGLAKLTPSRSAADDLEELPTLTQTREGMVMGTPHYMSPEQAKGEVLDHRSDIFSLGVMLFEMATGEKPFQGTSAIELLSAVLRDQPTPMTETHPELPRSLDRLVRRCLEKNSDHRYQTAREVLNELQGLRTGSESVQGAVTDVELAVAQQTSADTKSIVVLPFANLSPDPDTEYFSDGLTDEIITDLSQVEALRVISRSSAMRLKGDERGLAAIGRELACRYVLEGSVRRASNSLRITARLVDAPNEAQLWADKYGGTLDDVFDIQERVSRSIVDALEIRLTPQEAAQLAERPIDDVRAQESYLRARSEIWSFMPGSLDLAIRHLEAALELIGDNALVYQGLGEAYFQYVNIGAAIGREEELIQKAEWCVDKIFALEPESPRGYLVRSQTRLARGDIHACGRSLQRVLQAYPNEIVALQLYTHTLGWLGGKPDAAAPLAARLVDVDPLNPMSLLVSAMVPLFAGRFPEAVEAARRMFDLDPVTPVWRANYVMALSYAGQLDEAEALTESVAAQPDSDVGTWWMGLWRAAWRGDRAEVLRLADGPYQQAAAWDAEIPWVLASAHAAIGATDEALHWLDRAIDQGMINYPFLSEHDRYLDNVRGEVRFRQAMERARREWDRFEV
jgi:serine/threonine protein kinase/Flp pilus assembly protein TadD